MEQHDTLRPPTFDTGPTKYGWKMLEVLSNSRVEIYASLSVTPAWHTNHFGKTFRDAVLICMILKMHCSFAKLGLRCIALQHEQQHL